VGLATDHRAGDPNLEGELDNLEFEPVAGERFQPRL